jgi:AcrR family transcriptional regulator
MKSGVTKAAVYRQFKTKEEIVIAITGREMGRLEDALEAAAAQGHGADAREVVLDRMIDQALDRRGVSSSLRRYGRRLPLCWCRGGRCAD